MNQPLWIVREVRLKRRCWPLGASQEDESPRVACPLCAIQHGTAELTAEISRSGYIECGNCQRLSTIETENGVQVVPFSLNSVLRTQLADQVAALREALNTGSIELLTMIRLDVEHPFVTVDFAVERIFLTSLALGEPTDAGDVEELALPGSRRHLLHGASTPDFTAAR
jgi:hypothetical protein